MRAATLIAALLAALPAAGADVTVEFVQDDYTVYGCYPVAGYLRLVNESTEVFVTEGCLSLLACEGFRVSVRDPDGGITMIPEEQHIPYRAREPVVELRRGTEVRVPIYLQKCNRRFLFRDEGRYEVVFELEFLEKAIVHEVEVVGNGCRTVCDVLEGHRSLYSPYILGLLQRIDEIADRLRVDDACEDMVWLLYDYHGGGAYARSVLYGSAFSDDPKNRDDLARRDGLEAMSMKHTYNIDFWRYLANLEDKQPRNKLGFVYTYHPEQLWRGME